MATPPRTAMAIAIGVVAAGLAAPRSAGAHGTMIVPESRIHFCAFGGSPENHADPACRAAIEAGGTQPIYDWNGIRQGDANGQHRALVPDGELCGGGNVTFRGMNLPRSDWHVSPIAADESGRFEFVWHATAPHSTRDWTLYLTRERWDARIPLRWDDLEEFCRAGNLPLEDGAQGQKVYRIPCTLPARSGRHVVFAVWQRSDSGEAFYSCSDVEFTGGVDRGWKQIGTIAAPEALPVGTVIAFRLLDATGADVERVEMTLAEGQGARKRWPYLLARKLERSSDLARIGVLTASGEVEPTKRLGGNLVYVAGDRALSFVVDVTRPGGGGEPIYPAGLGSYAPGMRVRGTDGKLYECRPFPWSGWCNQAPAAYAPGTGSAWADAWIAR